MAFSFSQGFCEKILEAETIIVVFGTDIALVDGGGSDDTITRTAADFVSAGFKIGHNLYVRGATDGDDDIEAIISDVAAGTLTIPTGSFTTGETAGAKIFLAAAESGSPASIFDGGKLTIFNGTKPTTADDAKGGATAIFEFDELSFAAAATWNSTSKYALIVLSATVTANALADASSVTWFRITGSGENRDDASTTAVRFDGTVGIGSAYDLQITKTDWEAAETLTINAGSFGFKFSQAA